MSPSWSKIPSVHIPRSSHSVNVIDGKVYIFGGEIQPRKPVDNAVHVITISDGSYEIIQPSPPGSGSEEGEAPCPRVGHTSVTINDSFYVFGGRGGKDMTPLNDGGTVYRFAPSIGTWTKLSPDPTSPFPQARSYHCSTATPTHIVVHAGCGDAASGRLHDTWAFDLSTCAWTRLADAPGAGRGGVALAYMGGKVYRFGGYNGVTEQGGGVDVLDVAHLEEGTETTQGLLGEWEHIPFASDSNMGSGDNQTAAPASDTTAQTPSGHGPGARSVSAFLPLHTNNPDPKSLLLLMLGEGKPSPTGGHDAAGKFYDDVWSYDPLTRAWTEVVIPRHENQPGPGPRGWFSADTFTGGIVVWGGLNDANEREGDGWVFRAE